MRPKPGLDFGAGPDVGDDRRTPQADQRILEALVGRRRRAPVGPDHHLMGGKLDRGTDIDAAVEVMNQLGNAVEQDVLVEDRGQPLARWHHPKTLTRMLVFKLAHVRTRREREDRMLHRGHVVLGGSLSHIEDEEATIGVAVRQQASHSESLACLRPSGNPSSSLQEPIFVPSGTDLRPSGNRNRLWFLNSNK